MTTPSDQFPADAKDLPPATAHCHIAEHHESGMMFSFDVDR
jgi:FtsP/CotA-like multicopper oxidase with cupredoxin domain